MIDGYGANFQRGALLRGQRRYKEASEFLGRAIEADPEKAYAYAELALCFNDWGGHERKALGAIDRAIALEPTNARFHGWKGWILVCQRKYKNALKVANRAVEMDPVCIVALNAQANAFTRLANWKQAEASARRILALSINDIPALNLLAQALRIRGRAKESGETVRRILALLPNNAFGHMNAGYSAIEVGDHLRANEHFLVSLQMDPHSELARQGLLYSLQSRVWMFRANLSFLVFARRPMTLRGFISLVVVVIGIVLLRLFLEWFHQGLGNLMITALVVIFLYMTVLSRVTGNIFLCFDPMGRRALKLQDKIFAGVLAAALAFALGRALFSHQWGLFLAMIAFLGMFAVSIYYPQIKDRWQKRRKNPEELLEL
jgi:tetratricopeptide (TPR) repeat protein